MLCCCRFILIIFGFSYVAFAPSVINAYNLGTERTYSLENLVEINDYRNAKDTIGYKLTGSVKVGTVWGNENEKLLKFQLISPELNVRPSNTRDNYKIIPSPLQTAKNSVFYAHWILGQIPKIFINPHENLSIRNLKRGIVSLFQYQLLDENNIEVDVSGKCDIIYESKSSTKFIKTKLNCETETDSDFHMRKDVPLGYFVESLRNIEYFVTSDGIVDKVNSKELFKTNLVVNKIVGSAVESSLSLKFDGSISNVAALSGNSLDEVIGNIKDVEEMNLEAEPEIDSEEESLIKLIKEHKKNLVNKNVGKVKVALALVKIIHSARETNVDYYVRVLNAKSTKDIRGQILDILAAAQTHEAHEAVKKVIDFKSAKDSKFGERYLQALAVGTRPQMEVIEDLLTLAKEKLASDSLSDTLIQTIASMGQRYALLPGHSYENVKNVESFLMNSLSECKNDDCKQKYLRGLQNFRSPKTISILFKHALNGERHVSVTAVKALRTFSADNWTKEMIKNFENIFYQKTKRFDSSARTIALDVLLELKPETERITQMFNFLKSTDKAYEVKQYLFQQLKLHSEQCSLFKSIFKQILKNDNYLNNYNIFAQKGLSTSLMLKFSQNPSFNASLLSIQEMKGGVLKRGIVDLNMEADNNKFSVFSLGMYAGGLSSFIGGADEESDDSDDTPVAGMELIVQGYYMRPLQFFKGQGELMGHVWSGTASEPTPAYQATTLLQDHYEYIRLQNGAVVTIKIIGAVSIDLNGQVKFSLWNKNANSKVVKNTAFAVVGKISLSTMFVQLQNQFTVTHQPTLNLESKIDFSSDIILCMQLSQPETVLKHNIVRTEKIPNAKHNVKFVGKYKYNLSGYTHALNQKNNEMCNSIHL